LASSLPIQAGGALARAAILKLKYLIESMKEEVMRKLSIHILTGLAFTMLLTTSLLAQSQPERRGYGYVYAGAIGGNDDVGFTVGGGGDGLVYKGVSIGGDIAMLSPGSRWNRSFGAASVNAGYHFNNASSDGKWVPFVTAGPTAFFGDGVGIGFNVGGGVNYWFKERLGTRFEFRTHVPGNSDLQGMYGFRVGLTFR
jgi:hypothetical protein